MFTAAPDAAGNLAHGPDSILPAQSSVVPFQPDPLNSDPSPPPVQLIEGGQWKYFLFFVLKAVLISGTIAMVVVNCDQGPPDEERQRTPSQDLSVAGQTCQINPLIDGWWVTLVGMGAAQFLWAAGAAVYYAFTGWFPRNSSEVYLLQLPVSTISLVSAGAGLAGGGYLLLMLSWFVVSLMSGFAVVAGLLTGVPGLFDKPASTGSAADTEAPSPAAPAPGKVSSPPPAPPLEAPKETITIITVPPPTTAEGAQSFDAATHRTAAAGARAASGGVDNPYAVTVQQYGRWYTALLLLYEFNKISDIATALILGVGDPLRVAFFVLGTLSLAHVQVTFYWLVGTRDGDTTVIDLYRGMGDVVLDTPMLCIEFYAIVTGVIEEANFTVFVISLVLKSLSTLSHIFTLYKDIKLFMESRSRAKLKRITKRIRRSWAKAPRGARPARIASIGVMSRTPTSAQAKAAEAKATRPGASVATPLAFYKSRALSKAPSGSMTPVRSFGKGSSHGSPSRAVADFQTRPPRHPGVPASDVRVSLEALKAREN